MVALQKSSILRILLVVVVVAVLGAGIWMFIDSKTNPSASNNSNVASDTKNSAPSKLIFDTRTPSALPDADVDGLSDEDESKQGTNPTLGDTDRDGLSDFDEIRIYHTDPKKFDTDADGHPDGDEVQKGFNPAGPGKLFDTIPPQTNAIQ